MAERPSTPYRPSAAERAERRAFEALLALPKSARKRAAGGPHVVDRGGEDVFGRAAVVDVEDDDLAVVAQETTRHGGPKPALQMLFVPVTDLTLPRSDSYERFSSGYFLTRANMDWYEATYLTGSPTLGGSSDVDIDALRADPRVSPLRATDLDALVAAGLPPAYVAVAGFDPLRDEGIAYARMLKRAGVATTLRVHTDAVHPFINILATDLGRRCMAEAVGAMRTALGVDPA